MYGNREAIITSGVDDKPKPGDNLNNVPNRPPKAAPRTLSPVPPAVAPRIETGPPPVAPRTETSVCVSVCLSVCLSMCYVCLYVRVLCVRAYLCVCVCASVCVCVCMQCIANNFVLTQHLNSRPRNLIDPTFSLSMYVSC